MKPVGLRAARSQQRANRGTDRETLSPECVFLLVNIFKQSKVLRNNGLDINLLVCPILDNINCYPI